MYFKDYKERSVDMSLKNKKIGFALTGSFCTYAQTFPEIEGLINEGARVQTIFSQAAQTIDSRFGKSEDFLKRAEEITKKKPILTIETAEPIGPKGPFDIMVILPCTGNTIAKLASGITDGPVLMAAKAHLRNGKPLVLSISTNDALGMNMKNIGLLLNTKLIYFVPFGQDDYEKKPNSLVAHTKLLIPTIEAALKGRQYQPVIREY
jgi:dipicolinate synthase subunit B